MHSACSPPQGAQKIEQTFLYETNDADVLERVDNFCKAHPTSVVFQAALHVSGDLVGVNAQRIRRALEMDREGNPFGPPLLGESATMTSGAYRLGGWPWEGQ